MDGPLSAMLGSGVFGEPITYGGVEIFADIGAEYRRGNKIYNDIQVLRTDVLAPSHQDVVVVGSISWRVDQDDGWSAESLSGDQSFWKVRIYRETRANR